MESARWRSRGCCNESRAAAQRSDEGNETVSVMRPSEGLEMKRFGLCAVVLLFAVSVSAAPACAQDKLIMGMGGGT